MQTNREDVFKNCTSNVLEINTKTVLQAAQIVQIYSIHQLPTPLNLPQLNCIEMKYM